MGSSIPVNFTVGWKDLALSNLNFIVVEDWQHLL
jgi:hypothetical protein